MPSSGAYLRPEDALTSEPPTPLSPRTPTRDAPGAFPEIPEAQSHIVGVTAPQSLAAAVRSRKDEFIRKRSIKIKVGTWNTASINGTDKDLGEWFVAGKGVKGLSQDLAGLAKESSADLSQDTGIESVEDQEARLKKKKATIPKNDVPALPHGREIDLYVLGLQEVIDVASVTEAMKPYTDPNPAKKWKTALRQALPSGYEKVAEQQLLGLLILVFASPELIPSISNVSCSHVGTGLLGYLGNKGAVSVRIVLAEATRLCFVNCHLAAGADKAALERRLWDTAQVVGRTRFSPVKIDGDDDGGRQEEKIGDEDFAFWFGDLNYRLDDVPGEDVRRLLLLHTRNEYDIANKSRRRIDSELGYIDVEPVSVKSFPDDAEQAELPALESKATPMLDPKSDPASLITTIASLLAHDQLRAQQREHKAFHEGWQEGEINFLPTYKYDVGSVGMFDSGEKKRSPSWCDRILFRTRRDRMKYEDRLRREQAARKKDEEMTKKGLDKDADEQNVLFDYDPDEDGDDDDDFEDQDDMNDAELVETHEGADEELELEHYISHQRVLSSDHKPLDAVFELTYDAVIPELKAKVHQEVARSLDRAENENRPAITMVVDGHGSRSVSPNDDPLAENELNSVRFGFVRYKQAADRAVTIANTGSIEATFRFISKDGDETAPISPEWLTISGVDLPACTLQPGETQSVTLTAHVTNPDFVRQLNNHKGLLEDVLILRVVDGRDHFLPIKGKWVPTCFCRTLDELVLAPEAGVRAIPRSPTNRDGTGSTGIKGSAKHHSAPRELFVLTEAIPNLVERSMADWDMLNNQGTAAPWIHDTDNTWPFDPSTWTFHQGDERQEYLANVQECLDTAQPIDSRSDPDEPYILCLEVLSETLLSFLESLRDGIITAQMWATIEPQLIEREKDSKAAAMDSEDLQALVMEPLSCAPVHSVSMTFLTFMLANIMKQVAPVPREQHTREQQVKSPTASRRSRASSMLSENESETNSLAPTTSTDSAARRFLNHLPVRRRRAGTSSSQSEEVADSTKLVERRKHLLKNYAALFAPLIIRSELDQTVKGKERKALEGRKKRVLEAFLQTAQL